MNPVGFAPASLSGFQVLRQLGQSIDTFIAQGSTEGLAESLAPGLEDLRRISEAGILVQTIWRLEGVARGTAVLSLSEAGDISRQIQGVLTFLGHSSAEAEERTRTIQFLSGGLGHDLNNALSVLFGALGFFQLGGAPSADVLRKADMGLRRMARLVRCLLELGKSPSKELPFNINDELEAADLCGFLGDGTELILNLDPHPWFVPGPPEQVARVIENVLTNARDAMKGSPLKRLTITSEKVSFALDKVINDRVLRGCGGKPGDFMRIRFADSGSGIDEKIVDRIFEAHFSTKGNGDVGDDNDHGLGLAVVRKIVADTGGFVTVQNSPGGGAQFDVYLPRAKTA